VRAREDVRVDLMRARHRLSKLLLRHGVRFEDRAWTERHASWLAQIELDPAAAQMTLLDYRGAVEALVHRRGELDRAITAAVPDSGWAPLVARLRCLRGIDTLSAVGLCAEVGDFARFARAGHVMSFLGLVPSEHSSGQTRRQGQITKSGSGHGRRLLVEAAWHYRRAPRKGDALRRRQAGQSAHVLAISWQAQQRLHRTWQRLDAERGKRRTIVAVAVARELAGFCWAAANAD
jgi:transposase